MKKRKALRKDPYASREAAKYDNPIPSREYILNVLDKAAGPMAYKAICKTLDIDDYERSEALRRRLIAMERDGQIISNRRGGYAPIGRVDLMRGRVQGHRDGFGFLIPAEGGEDLYLSNRQMRKVFDGDEAVARCIGTDFKGRKEGAIVEVLIRNTHQLVGRFTKENGIQFVSPDNLRLCHDVMIPPGEEGKARRGQFVVVEITQQPDSRNVPLGRIIEVLGDHMAPGMEIDVAIRSHGIPHLWPSDVQVEAGQLPPEVAENHKKHRVDLRALPLVTIDGEDARDFDDAVYCEVKKGGGWRLYVAIADVSHYVTVGSALDREAEQRGTSVYFPDFVVPMLPEALSNGLCSLNPIVDRLCMVCEMTVSAAGRVSGYQFYEGVMHSKARLTYTQVGQMLVERGNKRSDIRKQFREIVPYIDELHALYRALRGARELRGAIDFETTETRIQFDGDRKIERIVPVVRNDAHKLIEECMLCANVCAARFLEKHELPGLYRVHETPSSEKLSNLREFLSEIGISLPGGDKPKPSDYQLVLNGIDGRPDAHLIQMVMLRSMNQAVYQPENKGHFGLGYSAYAHFTSPIRRYPDLLVHRAIRHVVRSRLDTKQVRRVRGAKVLAKKSIYPYNLGSMLGYGEHCSTTERRADDATRDVVTWLKCEYLQDHVGDEFEGVVSAVTSFGLFVELKDLYVEGLIHVTSLPHDYYHYQQAQHRLVGERTRQVFRLSDPLVVRVERVDLDDRKVDFDLVKVGVRKVKKKPATKKKTSAKSKRKTSVKTSSATKKVSKTKKTSTAKKKPRNKKARNQKSRNKKHG